MALTLGITGMERHTESAVMEAFNIANLQIGRRWSLTSSELADYVIVDMDSLYGPVSWLRLTAQGRKVIGLTSQEQCQTDYRLRHPIDASDLAVLLSDIERDLALASPTGQQVSPFEGAAPDLPSPPLAPETSSAETRAPEASAPADVIPDPAPVLENPAPAVTAPETVLAPAPQRLFEWLQRGLPARRVRLQRAGAPTLLLDMGAGVWYGSSTLKPLTPYFTETLDAAEFEPLEDAQWNGATATAGTAQPITRLLWLGGLLSGAATQGTYRLNKWPETEREYPKHFRIATAMMKGPADPDTLMQMAGVTREDVDGFINANLATGLVEAVRPSSSPQPSAAKPKRLLERLRGE